MTVEWHCVPKMGDAFVVAVAHWRRTLGFQHEQSFLGLLHFGWLCDRTPPVTFRSLVRVAMFVVQADRFVPVYFPRWCVGEPPYRPQSSQSIYRG
jgi:hypothetical protein